MTTLDMIKVMANTSFDSDIYAKSESYRTICKFQKCRCANPDEGSAATLQYWLDRGLRKELHSEDTPANKWAAYLPVSENSATQTYPLLFVLHGANNPIYLAEAYGYTHLAAREKLIVIIPENESPEFIDYLFTYARNHYPVDWRHVYMVGYSLGGIMTARHAFRWPERFAAVGIGGMLFANGTMGPYPHLGNTWPGETFTEDMVAKATALTIPMCCCLGEQEFDDILPICQGEPMYAPGSDGTPVMALDLSWQNKIASVNNWRRAAGCTPIPEQTVLEKVHTSADIVTEKLGFPFEKTFVRQYEGRSQFIGDCVNAQNETLARFIAIAKSPHWPCAGLVESTWDFIRQFAIDPETGHSYHLRDAVQMKGAVSQ